jgi:hypothetical protein
MWTQARDDCGFGLDVVLGICLFEVQQTQAGQVENVDRHCSYRTEFEKLKTRSSSPSNKKKPPVIWRGLVVLLIGQIDAHVCLLGPTYLPMHQW